jgi:hypothetical protein
MKCNSFTIIVGGRVAAGCASTPPPPAPAPVTAPTAPAPRNRASP